MKVIKPLRLSFLHRVFDHDRKHFFVATVLAFFPYDDPKRILPEVELWKLVGAEFGKFGVFDHSMAKLSGELLVTGACFPPGGKPVPYAHVKVSMGPIDKMLYVIGDRTWGLVGPSEPQPFTRMPVDYEHAFGGEKFPQNPVGKGFAPIKTDSGATVHPLPNVEDPRKIVKSKSDKPSPVSLGPWDITWPHHFAKMGTYDQKWVQEQFPGLALDADFKIFNVAPPDQRLEGYFRGDEMFRVENMHPTKSQLESRLPGVVARCFVQFAPGYAEEFAEIPMRLDTVHLFPHAERGVLVFRGARVVDENDASDIAVAVSGLEELGAEPLPAAHYRTVLEQRMDKKRAHLYILRDKDLMPASAIAAGKNGQTSTDELDTIVETDGIAQKNLRRRMEREVEAAKQKLRDAGVDPATMPHLSLPPPEEDKAPSLDDMPEFVEKFEARADAAKLDAEKRRDEAMAKIRELCQKHKLDYDEMLAKAKKESAGPPKFTAEGEIEKLRDMVKLGENAGLEIPGVREKLADPKLYEKLKTAEDQLHEAYRQSAHFQEPVSPREPEVNAKLREEITTYCIAGMSLARRDYTGADLSGMDLSGADLEDAYLEGVNLSNANLRGANLRRAVLAKADLRGANLDSAVLSEANLGKAVLTGASAKGADFTKAILYEADLRGAKLEDATLTEALLLEVLVDPETDLSGVRAEKLFFLRTNLSGIRARGARLLLCNFVEADISGADFAGAEVKSAGFIQCRGDKANFSGANLQNLRLVQSCSFEEADFRSAVLSGSNLRGTKLARSNFVAANLDKSELGMADLSDADFSGATLIDSRFIRTDLRRARLTGANLLLAVMHGAMLAGADFEGANLFAADLSGSVGDRDTSFTKANVERVVASRGANAKG